MREHWVRESWILQEAEGVSASGKHFTVMSTVRVDERNLTRNLGGEAAGLTLVVV